MPDQILFDRIKRLCASASLEIGTRDRAGLETAKEYLSPQTQVSITWLTSDDDDRRVAAAKALKLAGLVPIPHIAARFISSRKQLERLLRRLSEEAGVRQLLLVGGDVAGARGPFAASVDVLRSGLIEAAGIETVGIGLYPEGHPTITPDLLADALHDKILTSKTAGFHLFGVTQLCFEAQPILAEIGRLRNAGCEFPVRVGLAGPASLASLAKFALRCGVGASARAIVNRGASLTRLLTDAGPDSVIRNLADAPDQEALMPIGLHIFTFGGFARSARWLRCAADGHFELHHAQPGFEVRLDR